MSGASSEMMMDAVMYGYTPRVITENCSSAPPVKKLMKRAACDPAEFELGLRSASAATG